MIHFGIKKHIQRGGTQFRQNPDRYFFIKKMGWFLYLRSDQEINSGMEVTDGVAGPFKSRAAARYYLLKLVYEENPELFNCPDDT